MHYQHAPSNLDSRACVPIRALRFLVSVCLLCANGFAWSQSTDSSVQNITGSNSPSATETEFAAGHGSIGLDFQHAYYHGDYDGPAGSNSGNVSFFIYQLFGSYFFADGWEARIGLPYIESSYSGQFPHPVLACFHPGGPPCAPVIGDDGNYHGAFQDWNFGLSYHLDYNGYLITPLLDVYVPTHNYQYYGSASIGERNTQFGLGVDFAHQFDFVNVFYRVHLEHFFNQHLLGYDNDYNEFEFDLGYFFTPHFSARLLTDWRKGDGITDQEIGAPGPGPIWAYHDRFRLQDHGLIGGAVDYVFANNYDVQVSVEHAVWGRSNADLKYALDMRLTRTF